ncbi:hypothetical protein BXZ70DRAFT_241671 [Cristinia sonorae]|uniref:Uncharacterized protein n=1 Tax=Cristinia sonorae TaxID=1940300 RepID=A0A8K0UN41_9AGAR|nr:hypothetical protein BXZ70DRAFT_241671 [Cristinia sonorae]
MFIHSPIPEIMAIILDTLRDNKPTLAACVAVSRSWRSHALPVLFHFQKWTVKYARGHRSYESLSRLLNKPANSIAAHLVTLEIGSRSGRLHMVGRDGYVDASLMASIVRPLSALQDLTFDGVTMVGAPDLLTSLDTRLLPKRHLKRLYIKRMTAFEAVVLFILVHFSAIEKLSLETVSVPQDASLSSSAVPLSDIQPLFPYVSTLTVDAQVHKVLRRFLLDVFFQRRAMPCGARSLQFPGNWEDAFEIGERIRAAAEMRLKVLSIDMANRYAVLEEHFGRPVSIEMLERLNLSSQPALDTLSVTLLTSEVVEGINVLSWSILFGVLSLLPPTSALAHLTLRLNVICTDSASLRRQLEQYKWRELREGIARFRSFERLSVRVLAPSMNVEEARDVVESRLKGWRVAGRTVELDVRCDPKSNFSFSGNSWSFV